MNSQVKYALIPLLAACFSLVLTSQVFAVSVNDLIEKSKSWDKRDVAIQGEIIGDIFRKKAFSWINVNDNTNVIGIWLPNRLLNDKVITGDYRKIGAIVRIKGRFYRNCKFHQGETDIHAVSLSILKDAEVSKHTVKPERLWLLLFLGIIAIGVSLKSLKGKY